MVGHIANDGREDSDSQGIVKRNSNVVDSTARSGQSDVAADLADLDVTEL